MMHNIMINLSFNSYTLLIFIAVIVAVTFGFLLLFTKKSNPKADRFLAAVMFIVAGWNISYLILSVNIYEMIIGIIWVPFNYTLALGPCLYFYVRHLTNLNNEPSQRMWPHFVPVLFQVGLFIAQVFIAIPQGIGYLQTELYLMVDPIINLLAIISMMVYGYFARKDIINYHTWVKNNYSHYHRYQIKWLYRLSTAFVVLMIVWLAYVISDFFLFDYQLIFSDFYLFHITLAVMSIWLSIEAYTKPEVIYSDSDIQKQADNDDAVDDKLKEKAEWLSREISSNKFYLDPELSLKSLAELLDIHPNTLSRMINDGLGKSFSECINDYRVEAVKSKLKASLNDDTTFLAIAFDSGFNSKATFNRIFKKHTGLTPLQYQNTLKSPENE